MRSIIGSRLRAPALVAASVAVLLGGASRLARAEGQVLLAEIMPDFAGTEIGTVPIATVPVPGAVLVVRRGEVLRALDRAGFSGQGLPIPPATRISRELVSISRDTLLDEAMPALHEAAGACELNGARIASDVKVIAGPRTIHAELPLRSGTTRSAAVHLTGAIFIDSGGQRVRVPVIAHLRCPPPEIHAGSQLTVVARVGSVRASAPAEARQPGRVGEIIRVTNRVTGAALRARIVDAQTAEVVP